MLTKEQMELAQSTKLSNNFTLYELIKSDKYPELVEFPSESIIAHLTEFANEVLQPIRNQFGPIHVNSGYRNPTLNKMVGGEPGSIHLIEDRGVFIGCAADIVPKEANLLEVYWWIAENIKPIRTQILYRNKYVTRTPFIHVDNRKKGVRKATLEKIKAGAYAPISKPE